MIVAGHPGGPIFRPTQEVQAFEFLAANANVDDVILSSYNTGNPLPAWAPLRVLVGHGPESANLDELLLHVDAFYKVSTPDSERQALIEEFDIRYIFWGPEERAIGDWDPLQAVYLTTIYKQGEYQIFQVASPR